jgi:hypothetical protein
LIQIDGSEHYWFDDRGPPCALLVYIDDATGRLMHLKFVETESTFDYFRSTREYLEAYGKPVAFYANKHAVFRVNGKGAVEGDDMTQLGGAASAQHRHHLPSAPIARWTASSTLANSEPSSLSTSSSHHGYRNRSEARKLLESGRAT